MITKSNCKSRSNTKEYSYLFHPFEIAFCGYSGSGKTTLIEKLIGILKTEYDIGYVKHDVHQFQMDKDGKDTSQAWNSGASQVFISDKKHTATIYKDTPDLIDMKFSLTKRDFVFLEGYKNSPTEKVVVIDHEEKILTAIKTGEINKVIAFVGPGPRPTSLPLDIKFFHRDNVSKIAAFVKDTFQKKINEIPLFGLVLTGGYSTRMKSDKALISYFDKSQAEVCYELLSSHCELTFISSRENQWKNKTLEQLPQIHDTHLNLGPLGGILSAMQDYPNTAWLVAACDLPFLDHDMLKHLLKNRNPFKMATSFQSEKNDFPEPLCTIYEPKSFVRLLQFLGLGYRCPRKILIHSPITQIKQLRPNSLDNINTRDEYIQAIEQIKKRTSYEKENTY